MNYELKINAKVTCRTCLSQEKKLNNIFCKEIIDSDIHSFSKIINQICDIRVSQLDGLPTRICTSCKEQIKSLYSFRQMCDRSQELLNNIFYQQANLKDGISIVFTSDKEQDSFSENEETICNIEDDDASINEKNLLQLSENKETAPTENNELYEEMIDSDNNDIEQLQSNNEFPDEYSSSVCDDYNIESDEIENLNNATLKSRVTCEYCTKKFTKLANLKRHIDTHFHIRYKCRICSKTYTQLSPRNRHMKIFHPDEMTELLRNNETPFSPKDPNNLPIKGNVIMLKENTPTFSERKLKHLQDKKK